MEKQDQTWLLGSVCLSVVLLLNGWILMRKKFSGNFGTVFLENSGKRKEGRRRKKLQL